MELSSTAAPYKATGASRTFKWRSPEPTRRVEKGHSDKERRGQPDPLTAPPHSSIIPLYRGTTTCVVPEGMSRARLADDL
ncbi:hypothetical protein J6590_068952 [Homalodisca vitripennis]|nr:hypothetical protein J6590_068952 [Homalodisca vitripennis]